jgi:hypothetical protein
MLYHADLYDRMLAFANEVTPEIPAEPIVKRWLERLFNGDRNLHVIISTDSKGSLTGHAVVDVQEAYGIRAVICHQASHDKGSGDSFHKGMAEAIEYVDKLRDSTGAVCSVINVAKNTKVYEKKYGYRISRTVMIKVSSGEVSDEC